MVTAQKDRDMFIGWFIKIILETKRQGKNTRGEENYNFLLGKLNSFFVALHLEEEQIMIKKNKKTEAQ